MNNVIWSVIGVLVLLHGYFLARYQTYDPCGAAVARFAQDGREGRPEMGLLATPDRNTKKLYACYVVALTGELPRETPDASKTK